MISFDEFVNNIEFPHGLGVPLALQAARCWNVSLPFACVVCAAFNIFCIYAGICESRR